ncbi:MAG: hypothetical protein ACXQTL_04855 [Methanosarcinales archaeon]
MVVRVGEKLPVKVFFKDPNTNASVDPASVVISAVLKRSDGTSTTKLSEVAMSKESTGVYYYDCLFDEAGTWEFEAKATSAGGRIQKEQRQVVVYESLV